MRGSGACQTVGKSARAKAAPSYRLHNTMTARAPVSDAAKMLHAVFRLPGLESIPDAFCRELYAERSLIMLARHGEACTCMHENTHTQTILCGAVQV
jgi:hypothetical protein